MTSQTGTDKRSPRHKVFAARTNYSGKVVNNSCPVHNSHNHTLENCKAFQQMSPQGKENAIRRLKLCFGCLRSNHLARNCNRKVKCGIDAQIITINCYMRFGLYEASQPQFIIKELSIQRHQLSRQEIILVR